MGIHLYCGKIEDREHEHEWDQLVEICSIIHNNYDKNKPIYLLYNFKISNRAQIDLLIIQEKGICVLELKSIKGEIIGSERDELLIKTDNDDLTLNLFPQLMKERFAVIDELEKLRKRIFPKITENKMRKVQAWGYFEKGSNYDKSQMSGKYRVGFDIITGDDLIRKLSFVKSGYKLKEQDMIAIKNSFNVVECPEDDPRLSFLFIEKLEKGWIPKSNDSASYYLKAIKNDMIEKGEIKEDGNWILNLKTRIFENGKPSNKINAVKSISEILELSNYSVITGFAGSGKSIFLHQIYEKVIQKESQYGIPLYISLREIQQYKINDQLFLNYKNNKLVIPSEKDLSDKFLLEISKLVVYSYFEYLSKDKDLINRKEVYLDLFEKFLKENHFVFCLDGYDEITKGKEIIDNWISFLFRENISFILSTRPIVLTRLEKNLGTQGLNYYWLLQPNKQETRAYLENRAKKFGFKSLDIEYKDLTPLQLSIRSQFPIKLDLNKNQEFEFQIYGQILWETFKHKPSLISRIKSINDITKLLKSENDERTGAKYSVYDLINGPVDRQYTKKDLHNDASILGICGELAYLSYSGEIDTEYVEKLYKENPYNPLFVDIFTLPAINKSIVYFNLPQLRDYFTVQYIYSMYKKGNIISLINSDIMKLFYNLLFSKKPWEKDDALSQFGRNANEIIVKYLTNNQIKLKPTEFLNDTGDKGHLFVMGRFRMGTPNWYEKLVQGIVNEIINENDPIRNEKLSNRLLTIIQRIPELALDSAYDSIVKDREFGSYSQSIHPYQYEKQIREIFPEFNGPLVNHIQELFDSLNVLPENGLCTACNIESEINERDKKAIKMDFKDDDADDEEDFNEELNYLMSLNYTFNLIHEINGNPSQTYLLNLLESNIDDGIKDWSILVNEYDSIIAFQGLLRHRADFTDDDYLQYIAYRMIEVARTEHLALYAIKIWKSLLNGMATDGGGHIPGPEMIYEYGFKAIDSLLKKEIIWEYLIGYLFSKITNSNYYSKLGILLFENIREYISEDLFKQLVFKLVSKVMYLKDENLSKQLNCLKGFEDFWLPILLDSGEKGFYLLSYLNLENYDFTEYDLEQIYLVTKNFIETRSSGEINPQILVYLLEEGYTIVWNDFLNLLGSNMKTDAYFRKLISNISEETLLQAIDELDNNIDKLLAVIISRKNQNYLEDFLSCYFLKASLIDIKTLFQNWLKQLFDDDKEMLIIYKLEQHIKLWLFSEIKNYNFINVLLSDINLNLKLLTDFFEKPVSFYGRDLVDELPTEEFWNLNITEEILKNILDKMIVSLDNEYPPSHKYWIKLLLPFLDTYSNLDNLANNYITKLLATKFSNVDKNDLLFYYKENPHSKFKELFLKAIENISAKQEVQNSLDVLKYQVYNIENKGILKKKKLNKQSKIDLEYFRKIVDILIEKDVELLEKSIYSEISQSNFELIDLAAKLESLKINEYALKILQCQIPSYLVDKTLDVIEQYCEISLPTKELEKIESILQKELDEQIKKDRKWRIERLEKLLERCRNLTKSMNNSK